METITPTSLTRIDQTKSRDAFSMTHPTFDRSYEILYDLSAFFLSLLLHDDMGISLARVVLEY